jgi:hypothetical protein
MQAEDEKLPKSAAERRRDKETILLPFPLDGLAGFEASLHKVPRTIRGDCGMVFPDVRQFLAQKKAVADGRELLVSRSSSVLSFLSS